MGDCYVNAIEYQNSYYSQISIIAKTVIPTFGVHEMLAWGNWRVPHLTRASHLFSAKCIPKEQSLVLEHSAMLTATTNTHHDIVLAGIIRTGAIPSTPNSHP